MRLPSICILFIAILFYSCKEKSTASISPEKMQRVLLDIHLAETYSMTLHEDSTRRNSERNLDSLAVFYRSIWKHHNITQQEFEQSLTWYKRNPETLDSIYTAMIPEIIKLEGIYNQ